MYVGVCVPDLLTGTYFILTLIQILTYNLRRGCSVKDMVSVSIRSDNCNVIIHCFVQKDVAFFISG